MLANGITLSYKEKNAEGNFTVLAGLKEVPELGIEPEKVENTCLSDTVKKYEFGVGDAGDLNYVFKYENGSATSPYRVLRNHAANKTLLSFQETLPDGTVYAYDAQVTVKRSGGGVNAAIDFTLTMALQSEITVTDPQA